ncbi:MAG: uracil-DNA glycosylase family protein [Gammaproteobacteria bacterium]|nr:uracil-DNA glycosylase family protein [Gammaproteobacteria bacterium]
MRHEGLDDIGFSQLVESVKQCRLCEKVLPLGPKPVIQVDPRSKILIAGQAPGRHVHDTGVPFDDPSGDRLRDWLGVSREVFYDPAKIAILPMGFCYPGTGVSGDLPPRPECARAWREQILQALQYIRLTLVVGQYAQKWHLPHRHRNLTETVRGWKDYEAEVIPLPHPSPRNNIWIKKNPWFSESLIPFLKEAVRKALDE